MFRDFGECGVELRDFGFEWGGRGGRGRGRGGGSEGEEVGEDAGCGVDELVTWASGLDFPRCGVGGVGVGEEVVR